MSKSLRRLSQQDEFEKPHHQVKQFKKVKEKKTHKKIENILRSKDINKLMSLDDSF